MGMFSPSCPTCWERNCNCSSGQGDSLNRRADRAEQELKLLMDAVIKAGYQPKLAADGQSFNLIPI